MSDIQTFRDAIEAFIAARGWTPTRFGRQMAGDPLFVFDLREGREPRSETRARILKSMADEAEAPAAPPLRIGVAGLGNVGATLVRILQKDGAELTRKLGRQVVVTAVAARSRSKDRGIDLSNVQWFDDPVALAKADGIDLFVELIGGEDGPALAAVRAALEIGRPVVTANKALLARHGVALARLAEDNSAQLGFEAAVAGGIPVIKTLREGLGSARIARVYGIMNGTCNYILTRMGNEGLGFAECLADAQRLGYAETDPSFDVDGYDTAHKLAILASLCFGCEIAPDEIFVEGITSITQADIKVAGDLGYKIKLLGIAQRSPDGIEQRVHPTLVPKTSAIAGVDGVLNAVALETDHVHELLLAGPGAGGAPTASSVLSDILDIARGTRVPPLGVPSQELVPYKQAPMRAHEGGYYIRLNAKDVPGAFAAIASRMGAAGISLESVIQRPDLRVSDGAGSGVSIRTIVLLTHSTLEQSVREALALIAADGFIVGEPQLIRIEVSDLNLTKTADGKPAAIIDRSLTLELVRVTERAAIAAAGWRGKGDEKAADNAAVEAMRSELGKVRIDGRIVIGEGERDEAPMLWIGEEVGGGDGPAVDIAVDPLEGTTLCAKNQPDSICVLAMAERGGLLNAPDVYMQKIAIGSGYADGTVDLDMSARENIESLAKAKGVPVSEITACMLDRPRHAALLDELRQTGCAIKLISDGDIAGIIHAVNTEDTGIDIYIGSGGAPEGVLAAAALRCIGGQMQGRLMLDTDDKRLRAKRMGIDDPNRKYATNELASGDVLFAATGVTDGTLLAGVRYKKNAVQTSTVVMRSWSQTVRWITADHHR